MKKNYDFIILNRVSAKMFPKATIKTSSLESFFFFPRCVSAKDIERVYKEYDVHLTYLYKTDVGFGIALLYKSPDGKIREVKEFCIGPIFDERGYPQISIKRNRSINAKYKKCRQPKEHFSGKELMGQKTFNPLPCPFGLHRVSESNNPIIRVLNREFNVLEMAAFDPDSTYISANEEQLSGELAKEALKGKTVIYYSANTKYEAALAMAEQLREQGMNISVSPFIRNIPSSKRYSNICNYVFTMAGKGWERSDIMKKLKAFDSSF